MSVPDWDAYREPDLDPTTAERLRVSLEEGGDPELELQRALTAWSADALAGDVRRAFLTRLRLDAAPPQAWDPTAQRVPREAAETTRRRRRQRASRPRTAPYLVGAVVVLAVLLGAVVLRSDPTPQPRAGQGLAELAPGTGSTVHLDGSPVTAPVALAPGSDLLVGAGSSAVITLGDSRIALGDPGQATRLGWNASDDLLRWDLDAGRIVVEVRRSAGDPRWLMRMPQAQIAVTGTRFTLASDGGDWRVAVEHGAVEVEGAFPRQSLRTGSLLVGDAAGLRRLRLPAPDARPTVVVIDQLHADDAAALLHALLSPRLDVRAVLVTWDDQDQAALARWCREVTAVLDRGVVVARGTDQPLTEVVALPSPAAERLLLEAAAVSPQQPLLVLSLGCSRSVVAEALRRDPQASSRLELVEMAVGDAQPYGHGRDPVADALLEASDLRRHLARIDDPVSLHDWPSGPLAPVMAGAGAARGNQLDAGVVLVAEAIAAGAPLPQRIVGATLVAAIVARWQERAPISIR